MTDARLRTRQDPLPFRDCTGRIGVFRALHLGDMLCAAPALRALRSGAPHARITLIGLPWAREPIARYRHYVYDCFMFSWHPRLPETGAGDAAWEDFRAAFPADFHCLIQLHGDGSVTNAIVGQWRARRMAGFVSGPAHLAVAVRAPSLAAASASDPARWAPKDASRHRVTDARAGLCAERFPRMARDLYGETGRAVC